MAHGVNQFKRIHQPGESLLPTNKRLAKQQGLGTTTIHRDFELVRGINNISNSELKNEILLNTPS